MNTPDQPTPCYLSLPATARGTTIEEAAHQTLVDRNFDVLPSPTLLSLELHRFPHDPQSSDAPARAAIVVLPFPDGSLGADQVSALANAGTRPAYILSPDGHDLTPARDWQDSFVRLDDNNTQRYIRHYQQLGHRQGIPAPLLDFRPAPSMSKPSSPRR